MKDCINCGSSMEDELMYCSICNTKQPENESLNENKTEENKMNINPADGQTLSHSTYDNLTQKSGTNVYAVAAIIAASVGVIFSWIWYAIPSIMGIVLSIRAIRQREFFLKPKYAMAITALIISIVTVIMFIIFFIYALNYALSVYHYL